MWDTRMGPAKYVALGVATRLAAKLVGFSQVLALEIDMAAGFFSKQWHMVILTSETPRPPI